MPRWRWWIWLVLRGAPCGELGIGRCDEGAQASYSGKGRGLGEPNVSRLVEADLGGHWFLVLEDGSDPCR